MDWLMLNTDLCDVHRVVLDSCWHILSFPNPNFLLNRNSNFCLVSD